ncbi:MAG: leucine-rich repeat domain-containing protein [Treponema sp.]|jgi:hypothetical protein|nr:leucine-rich repeat domain-containing protein [Treponema sp.]
MNKTMPEPAVKEYHVWIRRLLKSAIFTLGAMFFATACSLGLTPTIPGSSGRGGTVRLIIDLGETGSAADNSRTAYPDPADINFKYKAVFTPVDSSNNSREETVDFSGTRFDFALDPGEWKLIISGRITLQDVDGNDYQIEAAASNEIEFTVNHEATATVTALMHPVHNNYPGKFSYTLDIDSAAGQNIMCSLVNIDNNTPKPPTENDWLAALDKTETIELYPGYYRFKITAEKNGFKYVRSEIIHIYSETVTKKTYKLTAEDFQKQVYIAGTLTINKNIQNHSSFEAEAIRAYKDVECTDPVDIEIDTSPLTPLSDSGSWNWNMTLNEAPPSETYFKVEFHPPGSGSGTSGSVYSEPIRGGTLGNGKTDISLTVNGYEATFSVQDLNSQLADAEHYYLELENKYIDTNITLHILEGSTVNSLPVYRKGTDGKAAAEEKTWYQETNGSYNSLPKTMPAESAVFKLLPLIKLSEIENMETGILPRLRNIPEGNSKEDPLLLEFTGAFSGADGVRLRDILYAVQEGSKFVSIDLSACSVEDSNSFSLEPGLYTDGAAKVVELILPAGLTKIAGPAGASYSAAASLFGNFTSLRLIKAAGVTEVSGYAFSGCKSLETAELPKAVTIGAYAFYGCLKLAGVELAREEYLTIERYAFFGCRDLRNINLYVELNFNLITPTIYEKLNVKSIGEYAFFNAGLGPKLDLIVDSASITSSGVIPIDNYAFANCINLKELTLKTSSDSSSVPLNGDFLFLGCINLESAELNNVSEIRDNVFLACLGLNSLKIEHLSSFNGRAIAGCENLTTLSLGGGYDFDTNTKILYKNEPDKKILIAALRLEENLVIPADVKEIGEKAFFNAAIIKTVTMLGVENIGADAFQGCTNLSKVTTAAALPAGFDRAMPSKIKTLTLAGVETIAENFANLKNSLETITLTNVTRIAAGAFADWNNLTAANLPAVTRIEAGAFANCSKLTAPIMPAAEYIGGDAFKNCTLLNTLDLPKVTEIGAGAFSGCAVLANLTMPKVTKIGDKALEGANLSDVTTAANAGKEILKVVVNNAVSTLTVRGMNMVWQAFNETRRGISRLNMPDAVEITNGALQNSLISVVDLPNVHTVGQQAFMNCNNFISISLPEAQVIGFEAFKECNALTTILLPKARQIDEAAFYKCINLKNMNLSSLETIGYNTFAECTSLQNIDLPEAQVIGAYAFYKCKSLEVLSIPKVTFTGNYALLTGDEAAPGGVLKELTTGAALPGNFYDAFNGFVSKRADKTLTLKGLESILADNFFGLFTAASKVETLILQDVKSIGANAFAGCDGLKTLSMPAATSIGDSAFRDCSSLSVLITGDAAPAGLGQALKGSVFLDLTIKGAKAITKSSGFNGPGIIIRNITLQDALTIGPDAFSGCTNLITLTAPLAKSIGAAAFSNCTMLVSITLHNALTIESDAFSGCTNLWIASLPKVTSIGTEAFLNCAKLTTDGEKYFLPLPELKTIGNYAFENTRGLRDIQLPVITTIGKGAFKNSGIQGDLTLDNAGFLEIGEEAFSGCGDITGIVSTVKRINARAFEGCTKLNNARLSQVASIGAGAFSGCVLFVSLYLPADPPELVKTYGGDNTYGIFKGTHNLNYASWATLRIFLPGTVTVLSAYRSKWGFTTENVSIGGPEIPSNSERNIFGSDHKAILFAHNTDL